MYTHLLCSTRLTTSEEICFATEEAEKCVYQLLREKQTINSI